MPGKNKKGGRGALETTLAPVAALMTLGAAVIQGVRRGKDRPSDGDVIDLRGDQAAPVPGPDGRIPPGHVDTPDLPGAAGEEPVERLPGLMGKIQAKVDRRGLRWIDVVLRVQKRFGDLHGNYLAGAISMAAFLAIFPLLLVAIAVAGFISHGNGNVAGSIIGHLGLNGDAAKTVTEGLATARRSRKAASVVGLAGLLWSGLGVVGAMQYAYNQVWQVKERGFRDRIVGIGWLLGAVVLFVGSAVVTALLGFLPGFLSPVAVLAALATNVGLWWWTAKILPNRDIGWRPLLPGAIFGGIGLEALKALGGFYVPHLVKSSSQLYGSIGIVFAILAWLLLFGKLIVYSATLNVVLWEQRKGTVKTIVEVPAQPGVTTESTRLGRSDDRAERPTDETDPQAQAVA